MNQGLPVRDNNSGIQPASFEPSAPGQLPQQQRLRPWKILVLVVLLGLLALAWFSFTAKSVRIVTTPATATVTISGGFSFDLGGVWLLRRGSYQVQVSAPGYHDLLVEQEVGVANNQTWPLTLTPLPGIVTITSTPTGAQVLVDGEVWGSTAITDQDLAAGDHLLTITLPRYRSQEQLLTVAGKRQRQALDLTLEPAWADIRLTSTPAGATVLVDGDAVGVTPMTAEIIEGKRTLALKLPRHKQWQTSLTLTAGQTLTIPAVTLEPADGLVMLRSTPAGAGVSVDNNFLGETPLELELPPGQHQLGLFLPGYQRLERTLVVAADDDRRLDLRLEPLLGTVTILVRPEQAEVMIDGKRLPPDTRSIDLPVRQHQVRIQAPGHVAWEGSILPRPGFSQQIRRRLLTLDEARLAAMTPTVTAGDGQTLVLVQPDGGSMRMGSSRREPGRRANETLHDVVLGKAFYLGRTEVTNAQFRMFRPEHNSGTFEDTDLNDDNQPAVLLGWHDAAAYCNWLSRKDNLEPVYQMVAGKVTGANMDAIGYRLATEAEWAWAARRQPDGSMLRFSWGDAMPPPDQAGNFADMSAGHVIGRIIYGYSDGWIGSAQVARYPANRLGFHDLGGNVAEWVHDFYAIPEAGESTDPYGPGSGEFHVIRGASWMHGSMTDLRMAFRDYGSDGRNDLGFRIARYPDVPK